MMRHANEVGPVQVHQDDPWVICLEFVPYLSLSFILLPSGFCSPNLVPFANANEASSGDGNYYDCRTAFPEQPVSSLGDFRSPWS